MIRMNEVSQEIAELRKEIREFEKKLLQWQLGIERAIGRIEGKLESLTPQPSDKTGQTEIDNAS